MDDTNHTESKDGEVEPDQTKAPEVTEEGVAVKDATEESIAAEQPKSWADYSDGEAEVVEFAS